MREIDIPNAHKAAVIRTLPLIANALLTVWWAFKVRAMHEETVARYGEIRPWSDVGHVGVSTGLVLVYVVSTVLVHIGLRRPLGTRGEPLRDVSQPRLGMDGLLSFAAFVFLAIATFGLVSAGAEKSALGIAIGGGSLAFSLPLTLLNPTTVIDASGAVRRWSVGTWLPITRSYPRGSFVRIALVNVHRAGASVPSAYRVQAFTAKGRRVTLRVVPGAAGRVAAMHEAEKWSAALGLGGVTA